MLNFSMYLKALKCLWLLNLNVGNLKFNILGYFFAFSGYDVPAQLVNGLEGS